MEDIHKRILTIREQLGNVAGQDPLNDRFMSGAVGAYTDLLNIDYEDTTND